MDFFEQICQVLAENGKTYPGRLNDNNDIKQFFSAVQSVPVKNTPPPPPPAPVVPPAAHPVVSAAPDECALPNTMEQLRSALADCALCPLARHRTHIVFGEGDPHARLMFVGEAPGYEEDLSGRPFVGKAGQLLDRMIAAMQFSRDEVYIANVVKCRPDNNRNPMPDEINKCIGFLHKQIEIIRPEVIVVLGAVAAKALLNCSDGISRLRGRWCSYENIPVMPTFHPAFLLRQESAKKDAWKDLQQVMARFGKFPLNGKRK